MCKVVRPRARWLEKYTNHQVIHLVQCQEEQVGTLDIQDNQGMGDVDGSICIPMAPTQFP